MPGSTRDCGAATKAAQDLLQKYGVTVNGFLPNEAPLESLSDPYYSPWERIIAELSSLLSQGQLRQAIDEMQVLSTDRLTAESEWRRAYVILSFFTQGYIWGGDRAAEVSDAASTIAKQTRLTSNQPGPAPHDHSPLSPGLIPL
jgi:hypothetical protein